MQNYIRELRSKARSQYGSDSDDSTQSTSQRKRMRLERIERDTQCIARMWRSDQSKVLINTESQLRDRIEDIEGELFDCISWLADESSPNVGRVSVWWTLKEVMRFRDIRDHETIPIYYYGYSHDWSSVIRNSDLLPVWCSSPRAYRSSPFVLSQDVVSKAREICETKPVAPVRVYYEWLWLLKQTCKDK